MSQLDVEHVDLRELFRSVCFLMSGSSSKLVKLDGSRSAEAPFFQALAGWMIMGSLPSVQLTVSSRSSAYCCFFSPSTSSLSGVAPVPLCLRKKLKPNTIVVAVAVAVC